MCKFLNVYVVQQYSRKDILSIKMIDANIHSLHTKCIIDSIKILELNRLSLDISVIMAE